MNKLQAAKDEWLSQYKSREGKAIARRAWDACAAQLTPPVGFVVVTRASLENAVWKSGITLVETEIIDLAHCLGLESPCK